MRFTKMHGTGNDFVIVDATQQKPEQELASLSKNICHRRTGVGADGLILIEPSEQADFTMTIYNSDGSRAVMCGNGARCVGKYIYERGLCQKTEFLLETLSGMKKIFVQPDGNITVDMGKPELDTEKIPATFAEPTYINKPLMVGGRLYAVTLISMGNPHCVVFCRNPEDIDLTAVGPLFENHDRFPDRINTEFVSILDKDHLQMRVWERGAGETFACGTGACASAVAANLCGYTEQQVNVQLKGGNLQIRLDDNDQHVYLTGEAAFVFDGTIDETR